MRTHLQKQIDRHDREALFAGAMAALFAVAWIGAAVCLVLR